MVSVAWGTALFYLAARLGVDTHAQLSWIDAAHVYVGLVGGVFVAAKVARVGIRYRVAGVPEVIRWQRWISWSLLTLYSAIWVSGVLLLLPIRGRLYADLVNFHLLASVWAVAPTTWHVWHYRRRAAPYLLRLLPRGRTARYWAGVCLAFLPAVLLVANARGLSQLPQVLGGSAWTQSALAGAYLDRLEAGPGGALVAAGDALYVNHDGTVWTQVDIPGVPLPPGATPPGGVHQHGAPTGKNLGLALAIDGDTVYIGTSNGLYRSDLQGAALVPVAFQGATVYSLAVDARAPVTIWAGTSSGLMRSTDGGVVWTHGDAGLTNPRSVQAVLATGGRTYASDGSGVFELEPGGAAWTRSSGLPQVVDLSAGPGGAPIYATSATKGVEVLDHGAWRSTDSLQSPHQHHSGNETHPEVLSTAAVAGQLYAVGTAYGVSASADGGQTWTQLGGGLAGVTPAAVVDHDGSLLAATSGGLYEFRLQAAPSPSQGWWLSLLAAVAVAGFAAVMLVGFERWPVALRSRGRPRTSSTGETE